MTSYFVVKQQMEVDHVRLAECDTYGCVTVHRTRRGAERVAKEKNNGSSNGYYVDRDRIRRDQTIVDIVD